jgi:hypothetical protein
MFSRGMSQTGKISGLSEKFFGEAVVRRILVTGSRDWTSEGTIESALFGWWIDNNRPSDVILISGNANGADKIAQSIWKKQGFPVEHYPADWERFGESAGHLRDSEMVGLGPEICFAFIKNQSRGATMTADLCKKSGIPVILFEKNFDIIE